MGEFNERLKKLLKENSKIDKEYRNKVLSTPAFYIKMLVEAPKAFKFDKHKRLDFLKFYEDIERMSSESLYNKIFLPIH